MPLPRSQNTDPGSAVGRMTDCIHQKWPETLGVAVSTSSWLCLAHERTPACSFVFRCARSCIAENKRFDALSHHHSIYPFRCKLPVCRTASGGLNQPLLPCWNYVAASAHEQLQNMAQAAVSLLNLNTLNVDELKCPLKRVKGLMHVWTPL